MKTKENKELLLFVPGGIPADEEDAPGGTNLQEKGGLQEKAEKIAARLQIPITSDQQAAKEAGLYLLLDEKGLALTDGTLQLRGDLTKMLPRLKKNNLQQELLVKAAKMKGQSENLTALDATAGMGEDSILLAAAGFTVEMYEQDPVIALLLEDSLERALQIPGLASAAARMHLHMEDSVAAMNANIEAPMVIFLDPMFPERSKSALIKKKFQLLQQLESPCSNEEELLNAALKANPKKIVIKRPLKGPALAGCKPSYSLPGKAIRYDIILGR